MLEGKRISELETVTNLQTGCCFPVLSTGATKRITFGSLLSEIENNLPETGIEEVKKDVAELKVKSEQIDTLSADVENVKEEVADVDEMVQGQNATIRNCVSTVESLEQIIEQTHFDDVLELEGQVRANTTNIQTASTKINAIEPVIPTEASSQNKLADKNYVDDLIETKQDELSQEQLDAVNSGITAEKVALIGGAPVGSMQMFAGSTAPIGFLICNGEAISRTTYAELFAVIGTTFGAGDGSTTFNVPDLRDRFPQGANGNLGESINAGLPNIKGSFESDYNGGGYYGIANKMSGAFNNDGFDYKNNPSHGSTFTLSAGVNFDASQSNPIYSDDCDTVQPPAVAINYIIKY